MRRCEPCDAGYTGPKCPRCGRSGTVVSVPDATMDVLVKAASVPSLATLFNRAKKAGVIGPVSVYGEGAPTT